MEKSNLVVTPNGYLKEDFAAHVQSLAIVGIHDWSDGKFKQEWRALKSQSWKYLKEEFEDENS